MTDFLSKPGRELRARAWRNPMPGPALRARHMGVRPWALASPTHGRGARPMPILSNCSHILDEHDRAD